MNMVPAKWLWVLRKERCPCLCGGEGQLLFIACPNCAHLALACNEVGTVFVDAHDTIKESCGHCLDPSGGTCPACGVSDLTDFRAARLDEIEAAGFVREQLIDIG